MNKTVAIVGKNSLNWDLAPFDDLTVDIWGIGYWAAMEKYPRLTAAFEVHRPYIWAKNVDMIPGDYVRWLRRRHDFPIYTRKLYRRVPASVPYPMDLIQSVYFKHLYRGKDTLIGQFFTSSVAYMIALALFYGYKRIEIYGVEMGAERYQYQRDSVFWWMGMANGLGVEVSVPENSELFIVNHYGDKPDAWILAERAKMDEANIRLTEELKAHAKYYNTQDGIEELHEKMHNVYLDLLKRDQAEEHGASFGIQLITEEGETKTARDFEYIKQFYGQDLPGCKLELEGQGLIRITIDHSQNS